MLSSASRSDQWSESTGGSGRSRCARSSSSEGVLFVDVGPLSKLLGSEISNWIVTAALKKLLHVLRRRGAEKENLHEVVQGGRMQVELINRSCVACNHVTERDRLRFARHELTIALVSNVKFEHEAFSDSLDVVTARREEGTPDSIMLPPYLRCRLGLLLRASVLKARALFAGVPAVVNKGVNGHIVRLVTGAIGERDTARIILFIDRGDASAMTHACNVPWRADDVSNGRWPGGRSQELRGTALTVRASQR